MTTDSHLYLAASKEKRDIERLLVPDEKMRAIARKNPGADAPRLLTELGRYEVCWWFKDNYEADASMRIALVDLRYAFLEQFQGGEDVDLRDDFQRTLSDTIGIIEPEAECEEAYVLCRPKSALGIRSGKLMYAPPVSWLVKDLIPRGAVGAAIGASNELKTWLALSIAKAVAYGEPWLGHAVDTDEHFTEYDDDAEESRPLRIRVLHIDFEMGADEVERRLHLLGDMEGRVMRSSLPQATLADESFWHGVLSVKPDLVVIDTLAAGNPGGDEKDPRYAEPLRRALSIAKELGTTFLFLHHSPKDAGSETLLEIVRGSGAIAGALDFALFLKAVKSQSDDPHERRAKVYTKKQRRGGHEREPFEVALTDAAGISLVEKKPKAEAAAKMPAQSDEDALLAAIAGAPGIGGQRALTAASGLSKTRVAASLRKLLDAGKVANRGTDNQPAHFAL